jgi:hypothetical protein
MILTSQELWQRKQKRGKQKSLDFSFPGGTSQSMPVVYSAPSVDILGKGVMRRLNMALRIPCLRGT